jgi:molybdopterin converting factor small subunit
VFRISITLYLNYGPPFDRYTKTTKEIFQIQEEIHIEKLIKLLQEKYGDDFKENIWNQKDPSDFHERLSIVVNGRAFRDEHFLEKQLKDGDKVWLLHYFYGG